MKLRLVLQVQPKLPVQPALSVCDTAMEHSADAQLPVPTAAELLTMLQERVGALEAQCSSQQVDCMQLCCCESHPDHPLHSNWR